MTTKYNRIGMDYNRTRQADAYLVERFLHHLDPVPSGNYLDLGCGTGNYTLALHREGYEFMGVDPSELMLQAARKRVGSIRWAIGVAENIPAEDNAFDGVIACLTLHHWHDLAKGFREVDRVLRPGGNFVIFTTTPGQTAGYWLNHYFPEMMSASIRQLPSLERINESLANTGLKVVDQEKYFVQNDLADKFLYAGKHDPAFYLDSRNRQGISSFSALSDPEEVRMGLAALKSAITSGEIDEVIKRNTNNDDGDYLFLRLRSEGRQ